METANRPSEPAAPGIITVAGKDYMSDAKANLVPLELIKPADKLEDEVVRKIAGHAVALSDQIARFRGHSFTDLGEFDALLEQDYGLSRGGKKGNRTYTSFDGCLKVTVQVADFVDYGPQLQTAKGLVDECLIEWSSDGRPEIRAVVTGAFDTDKEGKINRTAILKLLRLDIDDPRWLNAMDAIREAMRIIGSKTYLRFYQRSCCTDPWQAITIDLAKVKS